MFSFQLLPTPLAADALALGQLVYDPTSPASASFTAVSPPLGRPEVQANYTSLLSHDDKGHFLSSHSTDGHDAQSSLLSVQATKAETLRLQNSNETFDALRENTKAQAFLRKAALRNQPLYHVVGLRKLRDPVITPITPPNPSSTSSTTSAKPGRSLPNHSRHDSATDVHTPTETIFEIEVCKVKAKVGAPSEPHSLEDIGYSWSYHRLDEEDSQLAIGLGKSPSRSELLSLAGIMVEEDFTDESLCDESSGDDGLAGF